MPSETAQADNNNFHNSNIVNVEGNISTSVNFALQQNRIPIIQSLTLCNTSSSEISRIKIKISSAPEFIEAKTFNVDQLPANQKITLNGLSIVMNSDFLVNTAEKITGSLNVTILDENDAQIGAKSYEINILAYDEWLGTQIYPELLASYVTPNQPAYGELISDASDFLKKWKYDGHFDGYLSQDPNRIISMGAALYEAMKSRNLLYVVAPNGFSSIGQRVRMGDQILAQKQANCLDLTLMYAGLLEAIGLNPLLILTRGHAFAGFWLEEKNFPNAVLDDASILTKRIADGISEIAVVETTEIFNGSDFNSAQESAKKNLSSPEGIEYIIDLKCARAYGVSPLPARIKNDTGWTVERPQLKASNADSPDRVQKSLIIQDQSESNLTKKQIWERKLLDLGLRNTLISMRLSKSLIPLLCNSLDQFEDLLAQGENFNVMPRPEEIKFNNDDISFDTMHALSQFKEVVNQDFKNKRMRSILTEAVLKDKLKELFRAAKISLEENGTNTLYLALGLLRWYESEKSVKPRYAPLILLPIEVNRKNAGASITFKLREDEPMMNFTILEKIKQDYGITINGLDPLPEDEHGIDLRLVLSTVRQAIVDQPRWDVLESAYIGIFSFTQFVMWNDIRNRSDDLCQNKIVKSLMEGKLCWESSNIQLPEEVDEDDALLPISADASQLHAINAAANGESYVLHGPPGTGKSQTITGLIGNALGKGKSILFVAEKMAALSVVERRLGKIGLGAFCLEIHSNNAKKSSVLEQLEQTLELGRENRTTDYKMKAEQLKALRNEISSYVKELKKVQKCGYTVFEIINNYEKYRQSENFASFEPEYINSLTRENIAAQEKALMEMVALGRQFGSMENNPLTLVTGTEYDETKAEELPALLNLIGKEAENTAKLIEDCCKTIKGEAVSYCSLVAFTELLQNLSKLSTLPKSWFASDNPNRVIADVIDLTDLHNEAEKIRESLQADWKDELFELDAEKLQTEYTETQNKWFVSRFFANKSFSDKILSYFKGSNSSSVDIATVLEKLVKRAKLQSEAKEELKEKADLLGNMYEGKNTDWNKVETTARKALAAYKDLENQGLDLSVVTSNSFKSLCNETIESWEKLSELVAKADMLKLNNRDDNINWLAAIISLTDYLKDNFVNLREWMIFNHSKEFTQKSGLKPLTDLYDNGLAHDKVISTYYASIYRALLTNAIVNSEILKTFSGVKFNEQIRIFNGMSCELQKLAQQEIYCRLVANLPDPSFAGAKSSELGILQRAIKNKGRGLTIRKLFEQIPNLLPKLCPCMLMSPISVAQYLDPNHEPFDLVVFDEASQLPTRKAIGAIARGKNAVIVGDPKQMPPTSFFMSANEDEDNIEMEDLESILDDCLALNLPSSHLLWHYRSRHESLIAFSNQKFYGNDLLTFPSVNDREQLVSLVKVNGIFDRGGKRVNKAEAEAIVQEIISRSKDPIKKKQSLGVVTFNISQQNLIDDLLMDACKNDPELEDWMNTSDEPLFIKNLENVQGDERDVILFSIAYGKDKDGKMAMNFGPLNRDGGWRRLNVAVTRSRQEMKIFSSIGYEDIDMNRTAAEGVRALRDFLEFAQYGRIGMDANSAASMAERRNNIASSIAKILNDKGYKSDLSVGKSKFNVDIAVIDPKNSEKYILGILLDGFSYQNAHSVYERELSQMSVLKGLGWNVTRLWSIDWRNNSQKEINRILQLLEDIQNPKKSTQDETKYQSEPAPISKHTVTSTNAEPRVEQKEIFDNCQSNPVEAEPVQTIEPVKEPEPIVTIRKKNLTRAAEQIDLMEKIKTSDNNLNSEGLMVVTRKAALKIRAKKVVDIAAPMSMRLFQKILMDCFGVKRASAKLEQYLAGFAFEADAKSVRDPVTNELFLWKQNQVPATYAEYRSDFYGIARNGTDVASQEVTAAILAIIENMIGINKEELVKETTKLLGVNRCTKETTEYFNVIIDYLVENGKIEIDSNGSCKIGKL